jgi:alpha-mannosidase
MHSMLDLESDHVVVWALKPAEDGAGQGTIIRLWNLSSEPSSYRLSMDQRVKRCIKTTHVETDIEPVEPVDGKIAETLRAGEMRTLRVVH